MECKVANIVKLFIKYWNISRMEFNADLCENFHLGEKNWNISRMECKDYQAYQDLVALVIGIYPEWNVKSVSIKHDNHATSR